MRAVAATAARAPRAAAMAASLILVAAPAGMAPVAMVDGTALPPVTFSAEQDHRNMLEQLGIEALRPGASGDENSADPAGHRRSRGGGLRTHSWERAQGELARDRERPGDARPLSHPRFRSLVGQVDDSAYPAIHVVIPVTLVVPAAARRKVPVLIMFWFGPTPVPSTEPNDRELGHLNDALRSPLSPLGRNADGDPPSIVELIAAGWGFAVLDPTAVQADSGAGLTRGIIGLTNRGQPRTPDQWGALRAWGWAASRTLDYLETDPAVDGRDVGIEGVSRYGKAALVTMAFDRRFAMALIGSSGRGGAALLRRNYGETLENL
ncbi:MAG: acetylxylan esterase, partial [Steroidobacteraceae bacterium]